MIICHCKGITDRDLRRALEQGSMTQEDYARIRAAGSECGGCRPAIDRILGKDGTHTDPKREHAGHR